MNKNERNTMYLTSYIAVFLLILMVNAGCEPQKEKMYRVGIINPSAGLVDVVKGFKQGMQKRGYREDENITYIYDGPLGGLEQVDEKISEMLSADVDLIYSLTTPASRRLKKALEGSDTPGVFAPVFDPVSSGLVESLSRPGGQITGIKVRGSTAKALEWLLTIVPDTKRIFIPFHITDKAACQTVEDLEATASKIGIGLITEDVTDAEDLENALAKIPDNVDALWLTCSHLLFSHVDKIVNAAAVRKIPVASSTHSRERSGILVAYGENDLRLGEQAGRLADKILKGAHPAHIPVENAEYILVINLQSARDLGIEVPETVLRQADIIVR